MKIEPAHISIVKSSFEKMQTKEDLLQLLNEVKPLIYGNKTIPFDLKQLTWYANPKLSLKRYTEFKIKKKSGSERSIHAPIKGLKALQKTLSIILQCIFQPHQAAMGFVPDKSIVDNAKLHTGSKFVYNIDLKDFFPSVDQARVWKCLQLRPFNLNNNTPKSNRIQLANMLAAICCTEMEVERKNEHGQWELVKRNVLPQGAPTSPVISNIVCQRLDYLLTGVAKRFGLNYSRYADDITFSAMYDVFQAESDFQKELHRIITEQGFHIKESKTRLQKSGYRKEVTGLLVNEHVNVQQRYIKQLRMWLYYWERYGEEKAYGFFLQQYLADKGHIVKGKPNMANVIKGKLDYLKMVKGGENELYLKLRGRFEILTKNNKNEVSKPKEDSKRLISHKPLLTIEFLKNFKYDNNTGLKELVHKPFDSNSFVFSEVIKTVKKHPVFVSKYNGQKSKDFKGQLPIGLYHDVTKLIDLLSIKGLDFFNKTNNHPIECPELSKEIQEFKRKYRFGSEKTEYSILKDLISNVANIVTHPDAEKGSIFSFGDDDTSGQFNKSQLFFLPSDKIFTMRAGFFTWVPYVKNTLWWIFQSILQHSNIDGKRDFDIGSKKIDIEIIRERITEKSITEVKLIISDNKSIFKKSPEQLVTDLKGSEPYTKYLRSIADWTIEFDCEDGNSYSLNMLPEAGKIVQLQNKVDSFKHIITFYD